MPNLILWPDGSAAQAGDLSERLYAKSRTTLRPALAKRLGSMHDAEDVLHEAFARFIMTYSGRIIASPLALLARIAMNIVRDTNRTESYRRHQMEWRDQPVCASPPFPDPESACSTQQLLSQLQNAIDRLPPRCREVFLLTRIEGMAHADAAAILGISRSAVEKHLARANALLRADLGIGWDGVDSFASSKA